MQHHRQERESQAHNNNYNDYNNDAMRRARGKRRTRAEKTRWLSKRTVTQSDQHLTLVELAFLSCCSWQLLWQLLVAVVVAVVVAVAVSR
jgi:hypothetical protein